MGDRIVPGAFTDTLASWEAKGQPIPVIFAHQWNDLDAHIGKVVQATEREDGLFVRGQLNIDEDFARRVWRRMKDGTLTGFSFAYEVLDAKRVDGVNELRKLDLLEVGPCLVPANPSAALLSVKDAGLKPYPNEHACRLRDPDDFDADTFRRTERETDGKTYAVIMGKLKGEDTMTEQSYRYPTADWRADAAREHCHDHGGTFEPADETMKDRRGDLMDTQVTLEQVIAASESKASSAPRGKVATGGWGDAWVRHWSNLDVKAVPPVGMVLMPDLLAPAPPDTPASLLDLPARQSTSSDVYSYLQESTKVHAAAAVATGAEKPTSDYVLTRQDGRIETIAHLSPPLANQWLDDFAGFGQFLDTTMREGLTLAVEREVLTGSGVSPHLEGIFSTGGVVTIPYTGDPVAGLRQAITALQVAPASPTAIVMCPEDWEALELLSVAPGGEFLLRTARAPVPVDSSEARVWGLPVVLSTQCPSGYAVVADWPRSTMLFLRQGPTVSWHEGLAADSGENLFAQNQRQLRCELRVGFAVPRPAGIVIVELTGS